MPQETTASGDALAPYDDAYFRQRYRPDEPPNPYTRAVSGALVSRYMPQRVLDVGCGVGTLLRAFLEHDGVEAFGVEGAQAAIDMSPVGDRIARVDLNDDPFPHPDAHFDLVTCIEVAEHVAREDVWLREVGRVLKPGGVFFLQTPNRYSIAAKMDPTHVNVRNKWEWVRRARGVGLKPLHGDLYAMERELPIGHYGRKLPRWVRYGPWIQWPVVLTGTRTLFRKT